MSGIKLHITVDTFGLPHAVHITCANIPDRKGALDMIAFHLEDLSSVSKLLVDGGYSGDNFADSVEEIHGADAQVAKRNEFHKFCVLPKRWLVERTFGWPGKNRRLWKNCERKLRSSLQMALLAFVSLLIIRFQVGSENNIVPTRGSIPMQQAKLIKIPAPKVGKGPGITARVLNLPYQVPSIRPCLKIVLRMARESSDRLLCIPNIQE